MTKKTGLVDWSEVNLTPAPILDGYFDPRSEEADFDIISSQPILEREVRSVAFNFLCIFVIDIYMYVLVVCGAAGAVRGRELRSQGGSGGFHDAIPLNLPLLGRAGTKQFLFETYKMLEYIALYFFKYYTIDYLYVNNVTN